MTKLSIIPWSAVMREVHFVGYNRDHSACFIRDEQNARRTITLSRPTGFDLHFRENPIGKNGSPPIEIRRAVLHVPACFSSQKEKEAFDDPNSTAVQTVRIFGHGLWKAVTPYKCWLEPKDDKELSKLLDAELQRLRRCYAVCEKDTAQQIAALPPGETDKAEELRNMLRAQFTTAGHGALGLISIFDTTLEMVRDGWGNLREKFLERQWAERYGIRLEAIPKEAAAFRAWLEKSAYNAEVTTTKPNTRTVEIGVGLRVDPWQWEVLESVVEYEIRFADGSRCWLDDIRERTVTDPQEIEDFNKLEEATEIAGDERMTLDEVRRKLPVTWKGETKPMGKKGLQKLCGSARVPFKFPMRLSVVQKLNKHRNDQKRKRIERLKQHNAKAKDPQSPLNPSAGRSSIFC